MDSYISIHIHKCASSRKLGENPLVTQAFGICAQELTYLSRNTEHNTDLTYSYKCFNGIFPSD